MVRYIDLCFLIVVDFACLDAKFSPPQTSALGGAPITGTKLPSKRKLAVNEVHHLFFL